MNRSVQRALVILEYLAKQGAPKDLAAISHGLGMNKSTVYRFLSTLAARGYVRQEPKNGRYSLGSRVAWLGSKFLDGIEVRRLARPVLERLAEDTGETVHLGILDEAEVSYVDKIDGRGAVRMASRIGARMPVHCTALGKALYAGRPEPDWKLFVGSQGLLARTERTITEPDAFYEELRKVREQGYSVDNGENEEGIRCVAAPIVDHTGRTVAALSLTGWTVTMTPDKMERMVPLAQAAAAAISQRLGFEEGSMPDRQPEQGEKEVIVRLSD